MKLSHGSLCTGYGGIDIALAQVLDAQTVWVSDVDKGANKVLAHRYPDVPNIGDMTAVDWSQVEPVDVLSGGTPCQDLSHAGARKGMREGTRSNLWVSMREAIATIRPRLVVWENVRGAYSADADSEVEPCAGCVGDGSGRHLRALGRVLGDLADIGYDARWCGLRAADAGAPHGRMRVFLLGIARDADGSAGAASGSEHDGRGSEPRQTGDGSAAYPTDLRHERGGLTRGRGPGPADGGSEPVALLPTPRAENGNPRNQAVWARPLDQPQNLENALALLPTPAVNDMGEGKTVEAWDEWTAKMQAKHGNGNGHGPSLAIEAQRLLPTPMAGDAKSARNSTAARHKLPPTGLHAGDTLTDATIGKPEQWGKYADAITRWEHLTREAPAPTEPGRNGKPRLSPAFTEWLMGLPAGWITDVPGITRNEALRLCGNGVVPQQCAAALTYLLSLEVAA